MKIVRLIEETVVKTKNSSPMSTMSTTLFSARKELPIRLKQRDYSFWGYVQYSNVYRLREAGEWCGSTEAAPDRVLVWRWPTADVVDEVPVTLL